MRQTKTFQVIEQGETVELEITQWPVATALQSSGFVSVVSDFAKPTIDPVKHATAMAWLSEKLGPTMVRLTHAVGSDAQRVTIREPFKWDDFPESYADIFNEAIRFNLDPFGKSLRRGSAASQDQESEP